MARVVSPLSDPERRALVRILGITSDDAYPLVPERKAALEIYLRVVTCPPLDPDEVVRSARHLIQSWVDSKPKQPKERPATVKPLSPLALSPLTPLPRAPRRRAEPIIAELLELDNTNAGTQPMTPTAIADVIRAYAH